MCGGGGLRRVLLYFSVSVVGPAALCTAHRDGSRFYPQATTTSKMSAKTTIEVETYPEREDTDSPHPAPPGPFLPQYLPPGVFSTHFSSRVVHPAASTGSGAALAQGTNAVTVALPWLATS